MRSSQTRSEITLRANKSILFFIQPLIVWNCADVLSQQPNHRKSKQTQNKKQSTTQKATNNITLGVKPVSKSKHCEFKLDCVLIQDDTSIVGNLL
jgi:hypothetical protein